MFTATNFSNGTFTITGGTAQVPARNLRDSLAGTTDVPAFSVTGSGVLDLTNNALIVDYTGTSPLSTIRGDLVTGYNGGLWNGVGIDSSRAASVDSVATNHRAALGFGEASTLGITSFAGRTVDSTAVVVGYVLAGDANLDGQVNVLDFNALAAHYNSTTTLWTSGNFNYDNVVNAEDFQAIASNYGATLLNEPPLDEAPLGTLVPEPVTFSAMSLLALVARRRRRS